MPRSTPLREEVFQLVREERIRQVQRYGTNNHTPIGFGSTVPAYPWLTPFYDGDARDVQRVFRWDYEGYVHLHGEPTWMHLIREEVAELFETRHYEDTIAEAVQVAALCVSLVEHLLETRGEPAVKPMNEEEWDCVQEALCKGGLREYIDSLLTSREAPLSLVNGRNRYILHTAYDAGDGVTVDLVPGEDGWFFGEHSGHTVFTAIEVDDVLYTIVNASSDGMVSVIVGSGLIENEAGVLFHTVAEAKAYIQGLTAK